MLEDLAFYFKKQKEDWAYQDLYNYPNLYPTELLNEEVRAQYFYQNNKPAGYKVDFPSPKNIRIIMRVDPCANKRSGLCCEGANESVCEDNTTIISGKDVPISWFIGGFVVQCSVEYSKLGKCGTYIEIHRPNNP